MKHTRKERMKGECTHNEYYDQFVTKGVINLVKSIGEDRIKKSTDEHFNDIPLKEWDGLHRYILGMAGRSIAEASNGGVSLSDTVCVAKAAARRIRGDV